MLIRRRFPDHISFHAVGGPTYQTLVTSVSSRNEFRDQSSEIGLGRWQINHNAKRATFYQTLLKFFRIARGKQNTFPFKDWNDFTVVIGEGVFQESGSPVQYQMYKRYSLEVDSGSPSVEYADRIIMLPVSGTITIVGGSGVSIDYYSGLVNSLTPPSGWYGEFDNLCRFDTDQMDAEIVDARHRGDLLTNWDSVPIVEVLG